ncbi:MAG: SRPBCC family protein, partial [Nocardioidaceae bacterium]|nr:SRPBCC family protein [Nocardioidaceae bacterium]
MSRSWKLSAAAAGAGAVYLGLVTGAVPVNLGIGRTIRPLGPLSVDIAAPRDTVFDVISAPYGVRAPRAMQEKISVLERGTDMVLAAHYTPIRGGLRATTVETVRFSRPDRVDFRLVRGPVPEVVETFWLREQGTGT